ncbi:hypothetical protein EJ02DRAFT_190105 [Clathrospora elynae]|uniref:Uncharacterized protein n=1 Tax=Clathrospora elynae TaxID=706981 RepID=A0A6A5SNT8_9PLEO|nr:hypothetical protein EJ02DRAFT_190105 [Clathrospora elynae]
MRMHIRLRSFQAYKDCQPTRCQSADRNLFSHLYSACTRAAVEWKTGRQAEEGTILIRDPRSGNDYENPCSDRLVEVSYDYAESGMRSENIRIGTQRLSKLNSCFLFGDDGRRSMASKSLAVAPQPSTRSHNFVRARVAQKLRRELRHWTVSSRQACLLIKRTAK